MNDLDKIKENPCSREEMVSAGRKGLEDVKPRRWYRVMLTQSLSLNIYSNFCGFVIVFRGGLRMC